MFIKESINSTEKKLSGFKYPPTLSIAFANRYQTHQQVTVRKNDVYNLIVPLTYQMAITIDYPKLFEHT